MHCFCKWRIDCPMRLLTRWLCPITGLAAVFLVFTAVMHIAQAGGNPKVERYSKAPEAEKINVNLLHLEHKMHTEGMSLTRAATSMAMTQNNSGIVLNILLSHLDPTVEAKFSRPGVTVRHISTTYRRISAVIDNLALLHELAKIPEVLMISPEYGARTMRHRPHP